MAESVMNPWHLEIDDALVCRFLLNDKNKDDPKQALNDIINWEVMVSHDPAVSKRAAETCDLIQRLLEELEHATDSEYQAGLKVLARKYLAPHSSEGDLNG